jgi:hypothetical protein
MAYFGLAWDLLIKLCLQVGMVLALQCQKINEKNMLTHGDNVIF